jgi:queuine tRNA-ribosyltransferase
MLVTAHGEVPTPVFCPVGSQATIKSLNPEEVKQTGASMILSNTYHLYLRPGIETILNLGGLHKFMSWNGPILTDSGGFQIFSLAPLVKISDEGVTFKSHIDGSTHFISPEDAIRYQQALGSDIMMTLDEVPAHDAAGAKIASAVERTTKWASRCLQARTSTSQLLFGIIQGGTNLELRCLSTTQITQLGFDGIALGGLSLGEAKHETLAVIDYILPFIPAEKPRYLMGVGSPEDLVEGVSRGIDIFDSVLPTRVARNGGLYTRNGRINILNNQFKSLDRAIEENCPCYTCQTFSAGYVAHLFRSGEILGLSLATIHNLTFIQVLMADMRYAIEHGCLAEFKNEFLLHYRAVDEKVRAGQRARWRQNKRNSATG